MGVDKSAETTQFTMRALCSECQDRSVVGQIRWQAFMSMIRQMINLNFFCKRFTSFSTVINSLSFVKNDERVIYSN
jgi:hypothetical protein